MQNPSTTTTQNNSMNSEKKENIQTKQHIQQEKNETLISIEQKQQFNQINSKSFDEKGMIHFIDSKRKHHNKKLIPKTKKRQSPLRKTEEIEVDIEVVDECDLEVFQILNHPDEAEELDEEIWKRNYTPCLIHSDFGTDPWND